MKQKDKSLVFHYTIKSHSETNPILLRIQLHPEYTKIHFGYLASDIYDDGGWVRMSPETFIEVVETGERYVLKNTDGIPIAPEHHYFQSQKDWRYFTLIFPPLPQKNSTINIIEKEKGSPNDFNYYNISLKMEDGIEVL